MERSSECDIIQQHPLKQGLKPVDGKRHGGVTEINCAI